MTFPNHRSCWIMEDFVTTSRIRRSSLVISVIDIYFTLMMEFVQEKRAPLAKG